MVKIATFLLIMTFNVVTHAKNNLIIKGYFQGISDNSFVVLTQYGYEDNVVSKSSIKHNQCVFNDLPLLQDGVYQIIVNHPVQKSNKQSTFFFNIIIDGSESNIEFSFNPIQNLLPTFTKSNSNKNWYEFLKLQNFRLAAISEINQAMQPKNNSLINPPANFNVILNNEIEELEQIRLDYINSNFNKWSTYLVKNAPLIFNLEKLTKENYWSHFDTANPDLINTPIYQELIRNYIVNFCNQYNEDQYKIAFQEVINVFSINEYTKEWVVKYVITGLYRSENNKLSEYFSKKYNCKI